MAKKIGIIAEEQNDIEIMYEFTCKIVDENKFSFKKFIGHGCGKIRNKCSAWVKNLISKGCDLIIVLHDLDDYDIDILYNEINDLITPICYKPQVILIPKYEIESWLLYDIDAIKSVFNIKRKIKLPSNPENRKDPKEYLRDLVWKYGRKRYVNTIHNKKIANKVNINLLIPCVSFSPYPNFLTDNF